jgi:hypothetical protein
MRLSLNSIVELARSDPVQLQVSSDVDKIFEKLRQLIEDAKLQIDIDSIETLQQWMKRTDYQNSAIIPHDWQIAPFALLNSLPTSSLFPLLDILRLLSVNPRIRKSLVENNGMMSQ